MKISQKQLWRVLSLGFAAMVIFLVPGTLRAQWTSGTNINNNNSGTVSVGTSSSVEQLTVANGSPSVLGIYRDLDVTSVGAAGVLFNLGARYGSTFTTGAQLMGVLDNPATSGYLVFSTRTSGSLYERMRVNANGDVGIGTTSPLAKLHLSGGNGTSSPTAGATLALGYSTTGQYPQFISTVHNAGTGAGNAINFYTSDGTANGVFTNAVFGMTITNGNVGIGTTNPNGGHLHIEGTNTGAQIFTRTTSATGSNYGIDAEATGSGGAANYGGYFTAANATANKGIYINGVASGQYNYALYSDAAAQSYFAGNVGIGITGSSYKLDVNGDTQVAGNLNLTGTGNITTTGTIHAKYQDVAEWVPSSEQLSAGTVVILDSTKSNQVTSSSVSYDTRVAGVVSEQPGIALGEKSDSKVLVATTGRVRVKVDASKGSIHIGDLLVTSDIPGVAMKSEPVNLGGVQLHRPGTLIGKALEPLEKGKGEILVLLSLQ